MPVEITPCLVIDDAELEERFVRASGPGGQNVNKVATAVQLRYDVGRRACRSTCASGCARWRAAG